MLPKAHKILKWAVGALVVLGVGCASTRTALPQRNTARTVSPYQSSELAIEDLCNHVLRESRELRLMKRDAKGMLPTQWYEYWLQADTTFSSTPMYRRHQEQIIEALEVYRKQLAKQKHLFDEMGTMDFSPVIEDKR